MSKPHSKNLTAFPSQAIQQGLQVLHAEHHALGVLEKEMLHAEDGLGKAFEKAVGLILNLRGHIALTGIGKSGIIAHKIQATLASTGTPSFFIHPTEASHGDMGMITPDDGVMAFSRSGETRELEHLVGHCLKKGLLLIAVTSNPQSALAREANASLILPKIEEASPFGLAPTTSTLMQLAIGDALAITLLQQRKFSKRQFGHFHPGGKLGASLREVKTLMHTGDALPLVRVGASMHHTIMEITSKAFGCAGIIDESGKLVGVITDGDLRRAFENDLTSLKAGDVMTADPCTIGPDVTAGDALHIMNDRPSPITALFIVEDRRPIGIIHVHDLIRARIS